MAVSARNRLLDWAAGAPGNGASPGHAHGRRAGFVNPRWPRAHEPTASRLIGPGIGAAAFRPHRALVPWRLYYATGRPAALRGPSTCFRGTSRPMRIMIGLMDAPSGESNHRAGARCAKRCGQHAATSRLRAAGLGASTGPRRPSDHGSWARMPCSDSWRQCLLCRALVSPWESVSRVEPDSRRGRRLVGRANIMA